ncbi:FHA domain-containing protein [Streptomyces sp. NPDC002787]
MQIRLTVVDPLGPPSEPRGRATACDVLVTAPAGTALAAVASALASAVGEGGAERLERSREVGGGQVVLYAGAERLDTQRCTLGEPPLIDGAVLCLGAPAEPGPEVDEAAAQLHVVAGPDAGGVHLLHGGKIHIGRSADADVPLDDPDVSRLHCAVTLSADGRVSVVDLGSTNGTTLDGTRVGDRPVRLAPGALLRIGESALRLASSSGTRGARTAPDGEGHVRVIVGGDSGSGEVPRGGVSGRGAEGSSGRGRVAEGADQRLVPGQGGAPGIERTAGAGGGGATSEALPGSGSGAGSGAGGAGESVRAAGPAAAADPAASLDPLDPLHPVDPSSAAAPLGSTDSGTRKSTPLRGTDVPRGVRKRGGIGAWARRLAGGRGQSAAEYDPYEYDSAYDEDEPGMGAAAVPTHTERLPEIWPDLAALLLTALGPGPRLWERGPGHPEALTLRLGTADRAAPDGSGLVPAVPVTAGLREIGSLGLAGPRPRLMGLARAVVAQLAALHAPDTLEIVLISADRHRPAEERTADWSWLGWLPHLRPAHGQDCRLLLAYDREQATARVEELLRRVEDHAADKAGRGVGRATGPGAARHGGEAGTRRTAADAGAVAGRGAEGAVDRRAGRRPSWARDDEADGEGFQGPYTVVIVDGDPGGADVREAVVRLAQDGPAAGIHVVCLAEAEAASPASPVTETYVAACGGSPAFRACGAVALLSGDVATALRLLRVAPGYAGTSVSPPLAPEAHNPGAHPRQADAPGASSSSAHPRTGEAPADHSRTGRTRAAQADPRHSAPAEPGGGAAGRTHTHIGLMGTARGGADERTHPGTGDLPALAAHVPGLLNHGTVATVDAVSAEWAERFARALAPLRPEGAAGDRPARVSAPLPQSARLLDELGLARATPASLMARWADAADDTTALGGRAWAVLGAGPRGPVSVDLAAEGPHLLIEGPPGSGRTELLRSIAASLAAAERPDRLGIALVDGRDGGGSAGPGVGGGGGAGRAGEGLGVCTDLPHVGTHLIANDPVRMREFAQSLASELKRRAELLGGLGFVEWHTRREVSGRIVPQRSAPSASGGAADLDSSSSSTLRLRPAAGRKAAGQDGTGPDRKRPATVLPRLVLIVDDLDALLSPPLGSTGRPAAGSVVRALEAVAREGERLGVHLVATTGGGGRTSEGELGRAAGGRVVLSAPVPGPDEPAPGRGESRTAGGPAIPFQAGRVTGRIPRTATLRPTVVPLDWTRMGDPPARRPVRELGNGPTDLALLASALDRAAREVSAADVPSLL